MGNYDRAFGNLRDHPIGCLVPRRVLAGRHITKCEHSIALVTVQNCGRGVLCGLQEFEASVAALRSRFALIFPMLDYLVAAKGYRPGYRMAYRCRCC
jgi:hypothetical protein